MTTTKSVQVEFSGGLELLFSNRKSHKVDIPDKTPDDKPTNIGYLIMWLKDNLLKEREELFLVGNTVSVSIRFYEFRLPKRILGIYFRRPGILVLINDIDWELEGEGDYVVKNGDQIVFISTLHGG